MRERRNPQLDNGTSKLGWKWPTLPVYRVEYNSGSDLTQCLPHMDLKTATLMPTLLQPELTIVGRRGCIGPDPSFLYEFDAWWRWKATGEKPLAIGNQFTVSIDGFKAVVYCRRETVTDSFGICCQYECLLLQTGCLPCMQP